MSLTFGFLNKEIVRYNLNGVWEIDPEFEDLGNIIYNSKKCIIKTPLSGADKQKRTELKDLELPEFQNEKLEWIRIISRRSWQPRPSQELTTSLAITPDWARAIDYISNKHKVYFDRNYLFVSDVKDNNEIYVVFKRIFAAEEELSKIVKREAKKLINGC